MALGEALERVAQLARALVARVAIDRHRAQHDRLERRRIARAHLRRTPELAVDDAAHGLEVAVALERAVLRRHLVEHDAEREHVGAAIDRLGPALLGRHVRVLALHHAALGLGRALAGPRDAEVEHLDRAVVADHHVGRRHVAVHDPQGLTVAALALVGVVQPRRRADRHRQPELERDLDLLLRAVLEQRPRGVTVDVLHRVEELAVGLTDVVDLRDVGVVEPGGEASLVEEHPHELRVAAALAGDDLQYRVALERADADRARQVDLGHAAGREVAHDLVATEARPRGDGRGAHRGEDPAAPGPGQHRCGRARARRCTIDRCAPCSRW